MSTIATHLLFFAFRLVGTQQWTLMDTHSNKTSCKLTVLTPDTTYQVKVLTQCLSKLHKTNEVITVRTPEGGESSVGASRRTESKSILVAAMRRSIN